MQSDGHFEQTYGYFEARIYLQGSGGSIYNWPAFWLDGQNWPYDGEPDIMEGLNGQASWHFHSPSGGPGGTAPGDYTTIRGFQTGPGGDTLDVHDFLTGFNSATSNLGDFVLLSQKHGNTTVQIDPNGAVGGHNFASVAVLVGVTGVDVNHLVSDGNLALA